LLLDVGGVGYELHIPLSTYYELQGRAAGARVALHVHTHVRDDAIQLFGFSTELERRLFEKLIAVSGIGPRLAQTVLSGMSPGDLIAALRAADLRRLSSVPGIGKKTAERMIVELRDKVADLAAETGAARPAAAADGDLLSALLGLGYKQAAAERAAAEVAREHPEAELPELLKLSLKRLSRV
jgi:Holliday junction DNA helicase RuvA